MERRGHNVLHVLLTGEDEAITPITPTSRPASWRAVLAEGFVYQGEQSHYLDAPRGSRALICRPRPS